MEFEYCEEFQDIKFIWRCLDKTIVFKKRETGMRLNINDESYDDVDGVLRVLCKRYNFECDDKKLKEIKRLRSSPVVGKIEMCLPSLFSFYHMYYQMIVDGVTKNKLFIDSMVDVIRSSTMIDGDFQLVDVSVGEIVKVEEAHGFEKLYLEDVMAERNIKVVSGLRGHVSKEDLLNNKFLFVMNTKPMRFKGLVSEGMILCVKGDDVVEPIRIPEGINGSRLRLEGCEEIVEDYVPAKIDPKKEIYANALEMFKVEDHFLTFKGMKVTCGHEYVKTKMASGSVG